MVLRMTVILMALFVPVSVASAAGPPQEQWNRTFGGREADYGYCVQETSDGGFIVAGATASFGGGSTDAWLIKTDSSGVKEWDKTFGGLAGDLAYSVQETSDGGYVVGGVTGYYEAGGADVWLIKTDSSGGKLWEAIFGGPGQDYGRHVQETSDGGYIIAGEVRDADLGLADVWLIKTDSDGNRLWDKTFGGTGDDYGRCVRQTLDGGYVVAGSTASCGNGEVDMWVIKTATDGEEEWSKPLGGARGDGAAAVQCTPDGGYVVVGYHRAEGSTWPDVWLVKLDLAGNEVWSGTFGREWAEYGCSVQATSDGGYVVAGHTVSYGAGNSDVWLVKLAFGEGSRVGLWVGVGFGVLLAVFGVALLLGSRVLRAGEQ